MGWSGGSFVAQELWDKLKNLILPGYREEAAQAIVRALENEDWDTQDECPELMYAAYGKRWLEDEEA
jgi:hypothetical protein